MDTLKQQGFIFATIFTLANKLQMLGDEFDQHITTKQWLFVVGVSTFSKPPMLSELAGFLGYSRQNAKRIATDLQKSGYVKVSKDPYDARILRIELTPKSISYFGKRDKQEIEFLESIFTGFDAETTNRMYKGIVKLEANLKELMNKNSDYESDVK
jgi:DNA-binding MarR family transcriptional regulator